MPTGGNYYFIKLDDRDEDSALKFGIYQLLDNRSGDSKLIAECFDEEDAKCITEALNVWISIST